MLSTKVPDNSHRKVSKTKLKVEGNLFNRSNMPSFICFSSHLRMRSLCLLAVLAGFLFTVGCRYDMQDQPKHEPYEENSFFKDNLASRPFVEGTVARGFLKEDALLYTGKMSRTGQQTTPAQGNQNTSASGQPTRQATQTNSNTNGNRQQSTSGQTVQAGGVGADMFPFPVTKEVVDRGQSRFNIYCSVCHGKTGEGDGMIVQRGFRKPPSLHDERLKQSEAGHFFDVITNGWGSMPNYAPQISPHDRWAIIAYIRALQLSRSETVAAAPTNGATQGGAPQHNAESGGQHQ